MSAAAAKAARKRKGYPPTQVGALAQELRDVRALCRAMDAGLVGLDVRGTRSEWDGRPLTVMPAGITAGHREALLLAVETRMQDLADAVRVAVAERRALLAERAEAKRSVRGAA